MMEVRTEMQTGRPLLFLRLWWICCQCSIRVELRGSEWQNGTSRARQFPCLPQDPGRIVDPSKDQVGSKDVGWHRTRTFGGGCCR